MSAGREHGLDPVLITDAVETPQQEFNRRRKKYSIMMAGRALCVIGAACTYQVSIWLALGFIVGGAVLPWCAVLIANDRPAKQAHRPVQRFVSPPTDRALTDGSTPNQATSQTQQQPPIDRPHPAENHTVIDV